MTHRKAVNITTLRKENNVNMSIDVLVTVFQYHVVNESLFKSIAFNEGNNSVVRALSHVM